MGELIYERMGSLRSLQPVRPHQMYTKMCFPKAVTPPRLANGTIPIRRSMGDGCKRKRADMGGNLRSKRLKRDRRKSVQFSPCVNVRCFHDPSYNDPLQKALVAPHLWADADEVNRNKRRVKELSLHHRRFAFSSKKDLVKYYNSPKRALVAAVAESIRYEHCGESLRGMENVTSAVVGRKRKLVKERAIAAVMTRQRDQLIRQALSSRSAEEALTVALEMDAGKLARAYGRQTRKSLVYARLVAKEDAKVSAKILRRSPSLRPAFLRSKLPP
ncbi:hypothetical protein ACHAWF_005047 [Thalassiosira exigua]